MWYNDTIGYNPQPREPYQGEVKPTTVKEVALTILWPGLLIFAFTIGPWIVILLFI